MLPLIVGGLEPFDVGADLGLECAPLAGSRIACGADIPVDSIGKCRGIGTRLFATRHDCISRFLSCGSEGVLGLLGADGQIGELLVEGLHEASFLAWRRWSAVDEMIQESLTCLHWPLVQRAVGATLLASCSSLEHVSGRGPLRGRRRNARRWRSAPATRLDNMDDWAYGATRCVLVRGPSPRPSRQRR